MPLSTQPLGSGEPYVLTASLDNARNLSSLLRAVQFQDHATCFATANGLRVTVEDAKCIQANAFIQVGDELLTVGPPLRGEEGAGGSDRDPRKAQSAWWGCTGFYLWGKGNLWENHGIVADADVREVRWIGCV